MCARDTREHVHSQVSGLHSQQILSLIPLTVSGLPLGSWSAPARLPLGSPASWSASRHFRPPRVRPGVPLPPLWLLRGASLAPPHRQPLRNGGPSRHGATQRPVSASRLIVSRFPGSALCCPVPSAQQPAPVLWCHRSGVPASRRPRQVRALSGARLLGCSVPGGECGPGGLAKVCCGDCYMDCYEDCCPCCYRDCWHVC